MKTQKEIEKYKEDITQNTPSAYDAYLKGFVDALRWVLEDEVKMQVL